MQDYPKTKGGYSFEIGAAAVKRVLRVLRVPAAFTVDVRTVCRKDSQDITEKVCCYVVVVVSVVVVACLCVLTQPLLL